MKKWSIHNDLSGKEWIPNPVPGKEDGGWLEDVPRRLYIHTPLGSLTLARTVSDGCQLWVPWQVKNPWSGNSRRCECHPELFKKYDKSHYTRLWSPIVYNPPRKSESPRRGHAKMILKTLELDSDPAVAHLMEYWQPGAALVEALRIIHERPEEKDRTIHLDARTEIEDIIRNRRTPKDLRRKLANGLRGLSTYFNINRWIDVGDETRPPPD